MTERRLWKYYLSATSLRTVKTKQNKWSSQRKICCICQSSAPSLLSPISFNLKQFSAKSLSNNMLAHHPCRVRTLQLGKSWIRHCTKIFLFKCFLQLFLKNSKIKSIFFPTQLLSAKVMHASTTLNIAHANTLPIDSYLKRTIPSKNVFYFISLKANFLPV